MLKNVINTVMLFIALSLTGCGSSMQDITSKAEKAKTKDDLERLLGKPEKFEKVKFGVSMESWTYKATDGEVNFSILNGKVVTVATMPKDDKKDQKK